MSVLFILIPLSLVLAGIFLMAFVRAVRAGQFEDTCTPGLRILLDDPVPPPRETAKEDPAVTAHQNKT